jgi:alkaline phosphatase D
VSPSPSPSPPLDRRTFLKTVAVAGVAGSVGLSGTAMATAGYDRALPAGWTYPVAADLLPFGHGVMSGDPLTDRVVLWTRITIPDPRGWDATVVTDPQGISAATVGWVIARDPGLTDVIRRGTVTTTAARDWTVKIDADRLPSASTLYYAFTALGYRSPVGRTRTAPTVADGITELTVAHVACTSWWQDVFNAYARIGERDDLDLVTHAGDHVYDNSGGHPASRFWAGQRDWANDIDNKDWATVAECRRRYALYYADANLVRAHAAAPFAVMPDQHDDDPAQPAGTGITAAQARQVIFEWTAIRTVRPDGSGQFTASPGPDTNVAVPQGDDAQWFYRTLQFGALAEIILIDVRRFAARAGQTSQVLGDVQWAWLERTLLNTRRRNVVFRYIVNQVNLGQLRAFNLPFADAFRRQFGIDPNAPQGEIYTVAWGGQPAERSRLLRFLRENNILDNVVLSGDSHGWFGYDLVEDPQLPNYEPATGRGLLGAVGVELVPSAMGRPGGQDVVAEELYFATNRGSRGAGFTDAANYDRQYRTAALPATLGIEATAQAANPNLRYFNWRADFGHSMVHIRPDRVVLESWVSPQRVLADTAVLMAQFFSPVGAPHLNPVLAPVAVRGRRKDAPAPPAATTAAAPAGDGQGGDNRDSGLH